MRYFYLFFAFFYEGYHYFRDIFTRPYSLFRLVLWLSIFSKYRTGVFQEKFSEVKRIKDALQETGYNNRTKYFPSLFAGRDTKYCKELQNPFIFLPGLPSEPFPDRSRFSWADEFEKNFETVLTEFNNIAEHEGISPYFIPEVGGRQFHPGWNTFFFTDHHGILRKDNIEKCPKTWELLNSVPGFVPLNMTMFSVLQPHKRIMLHTGWCNLFIRVHLPLVNREPLKSAIAVGDEISGWEEGKLLFLDDSFFHQAWNSSSYFRAVLFFDVWHPDFSEEDIRKLNKIYMELRSSEYFKKMSEAMENVEKKSAKKIFQTAGK